MNILGVSDLVKIRVQNNTSSSLRVLLYQADFDVTVENYLVGAWKNAMLAKGATLSAVLPIDMTVGAAETGQDLTVSTAVLSAPQGSKFQVFQDDKGALDIQKEEGQNSDGTISVSNSCDCRKWVKVYKDGAPIISAEVRPKFKVSVKINPKINLALGQDEITTAFFDAAVLSNVYPADLSNQSFLTFTLTENIGTGAINVDYNYDAF